MKARIGGRLVPVLVKTKTGYREATERDLPPGSATRGKVLRSNPKRRRTPAATRATRRPTRAKKRPATRRNPPKRLPAFPTTKARSEALRFALAYLRRHPKASAAEVRAAGRPRGLAVAPATVGRARHELDLRHGRKRNPGWDASEIEAAAEALAAQPLVPVTSPASQRLRRAVSRAWDRAPYPRPELVVRYARRALQKRGVPVRHLGESWAGAPARNPTTHLFDVGVHYPSGQSEFYRRIEARNAREAAAAALARAPGRPYLIYVNTWRGTTITFTVGPDGVPVRRLKNPTYMDGRRHTVVGGRTRLPVDLYEKDDLGYALVGKVKDVSLASSIASALPPARQRAWATSHPLSAGDALYYDSRGRYSGRMKRAELRPRIHRQRRPRRNPVECEPAPRTKKLTRAARARLPASAFALPHSRTYPLTDDYHATLALGHVLRVRGKQFAKARGARRELLRDEARQVLGAVRKRYPSVYKCERDLASRIRKLYRIR